MRISLGRVAGIFDKTRGPPKYIMKQLVETLANEPRDYRSVLDAGVEAGDLQSLYRTMDSRFLA